MPKYDYVNYKRKTSRIVVRPSKVIILEGVLALEDARIRELASIKIFVESDDDTRFIRRLVRDMNERGRTLDDVIDQYLSTVKPMYHIFAKPTKRYADIIIPNDSSHSIAVDIIIAKIKTILRELDDEE
jgi:uridine kinase